ncbi:hypothetical protein GQ55_1G269100 [Panicum hallii var. hallii]|uniref:Uncharacterized protein n=1 Tax=Panicum hallii var. hallii TaxID=1504633 RepID=A0A2T7F7X2_9POAL|nr:hypothetical protein GQ55_1G269100 [Panicum hallii var. hallii]
MAPRGSESPRARRALTIIAAATALLAQLLLSSLPLTDAAAGSPSPAPAPVPLHLKPQPHQQQQAPPLPPAVPGLPGARHPHPRAAPPAEKSAWQRLNFGSGSRSPAWPSQCRWRSARSSARARQLRRRAAAAGKAEEQELVEAAAAAASSPTPA